MSLILDIVKYFFPMKCGMSSYGNSYYDGYEI